MFQADIHVHFDIGLKYIYEGLRDKFIISQLYIEEFEFSVARAAIIKSGGRGFKPCPKRIIL